MDVDVDVDVACVLIHLRGMAIQGGPNPRAGNDAANGLDLVRQLLQQAAR